jgi:hypothetical protein
MSTPSPKSVERKLATRTYFAISGVGLGVALLLTFLMLNSFKDLLLPEVLLKSNVVAKSVQTTVADALKLGIPFDALVGVEEYLSDVLADNPEINFIRIKSLKGREYFQKRTDSNQTQANQNVLEETVMDDALMTVTVGLRESYVNEKLQIMLVIIILKNLEVKQ